MALRAVTVALLLLGQVIDESRPALVEFVCPMDPEIRSKQPGRCSRCGMKLEPGIKEQVEYPVRLKVRPAHAPAGRLVQIEFRVVDPKSGEPVNQFEVVHEKIFHLFLISHDLQFFAHEHPELVADTSFRLPITLPKPGHYRLLADFYPRGGTPQLVPLTLTTSAYREPLVAAALKPDLAPKRGDNLEVELRLEPEKPIAGKKTLMVFTLKPGDGLEALLGAWGHMLVASNDLVDAIHSHPAIADGGPQMQFNVFFPREATYRVWVQFQRKGVVNTVEFTVPVSRLK